MTSARHSRSPQKILCRFLAGDAARWGVMGRNDVEELLPDPFGPYALTGLRWPLKKIRLLPPAQPTKIVAVGVNYADHAKEFKKTPGREPLIFLKPPSAVIGPGDPIRRPAVSRQVDFEGELALVVGRRARHVSPAHAGRFILGHTLMNDVTARDLQRSDGQWSRAKGFDTFAPLGPWIVTGLPPKNLRIQTLVNGRLRQSSPLSRMIFPIPRLIAFITQAMTLEPGDVISTGTPAGVGPLKRGDRVEVRARGLGALSNPVL